VLREKEATDSSQETEKENLELRKVKDHPRETAPTEREVSEIVNVIVYQLQHL
jgi:hypothetical protein